MKIENILIKYLPWNFVVVRDEVGREPGLVLSQEVDPGLDVLPNTGNQQVLDLTVHLSIILLW